MSAATPRKAIAQSFLMIALGLMPLAGAIAINFSAPMFAALAAAVYLHEGISRARGLALVIGFGGVLLVASPGTDSFSVGALFAIANAVMFGSITAAVRGLSVTESAETLTMYQMVLLTVYFAAAAPFFSTVMPNWTDAAILLANGLLNGVGQYWWTRALSLGAGRRGRAVLLFLAGLGDDPRLLVLGRPAGTGAARRLGHRRRLRALSALARKRQGAGDPQGAADHRITGGHR